MMEDDSFFFLVKKGGKNPAFRGVGVFRRRVGFDFFIT